MTNTIQCIATPTIEVSKSTLSQKKRFLQVRQQLPLDILIKMTINRINWFSNQLYTTCDDGSMIHNLEPYISFSGGVDSTVLLHIIRNNIGNMPAVFLNTGNEYPEIYEFIRSIDNIEVVKPKIKITEVIKKYGYPVISKEVSQKVNEALHSTDHIKNTRLNGDHKGNGKLALNKRFLMNAPFKISPRCCDKLKKEPAKKFEKENNVVPIMGTMASDSRLRETGILQNGCNVLNSKRKMCRPISFLTTERIWEYVKKYDVQYSKIYDMGYSGTGCMLCSFGCLQDQKKGVLNKWQLLEKSHPKIYKWALDKLGYREVLDFCGIKYKEDKTYQSELI